MDQAVPVAAGELRAEQIQTRLTTIGRRIDELTRRRKTLSATNSRNATTTASVDLAAGYFEEAIINADQARERLAQAQDASAQAHDRAAALHEHLSTAGIGDSAEHNRKAREHRAAAELDRRLAAQHRDTRTNAT